MTRPDRGGGPRAPVVGPTVGHGPLGGALRVAIVGLGPKGFYGLERLWGDAPRLEWEASVPSER